MENINLPNPPLAEKPNIQENITPPQGEKGNSPKTEVSGSEVELPYEENEEDFNRWFREAGKDEWNLFLNEDSGKTRERYDVFLNFLYENGTQEEMDTYLRTLRRTGRGIVAMNVEERLAKERPDLKFD